MLASTTAPSASLLPLPIVRQLFASSANLWTTHTDEASEMEQDSDDEAEAIGALLQSARSAPILCMPLSVPLSATCMLLMLHAIIIPCCTTHPLHLALPIAILRSGSPSQMVVLQM